MNKTPSRDYNFVTVHQFTQDTSQFGLSLFSDPVRRNLFTASGGHIAFGVFGEVQDFAQDLDMKNFKCTSGCATSTESHILDLSNGEYLTAVSAEGGNIFFTSFDSSFSENGIYSFSYDSNEDYVLKMIESQNRNIYISINRV